MNNPSLHNQKLAKVEINDLLVICTVVEILGVVFSILYLFFSIRQNILLWPMGIISALLYMVVFYQSKFYADMGLNGYYLVISIYGWILWKREQGKRKMNCRLAGSE